jgi:hypothetical protein
MSGLDCFSGATQSLRQISLSVHTADSIGETKMRPSRASLIATKKSVLILKPAIGNLL